MWLGWDVVTFYPYMVIDCPVSSSKGKAKWPGLTVGKDLIADDKKLVQKNILDYSPHSHML